MKALFAVILTYNLANNVAKMSFLLQYRRIFSNARVKQICFGLLIFVFLWAIIQLILLGMSCVPVATIVPTMADKCLNTLPVWYFSSAMNIVTDFVIFLVPLPSVYGLKLHKQQKILVFSIFCLGFLSVFSVLPDGISLINNSTCIISIVRIFTLRVAAVTEDPTWDNTEAACWSLIELNCGILCASLPTLRPLLGKIVPGLASTRRANEYQMYGTSRDGNKGTGLDRSHEVEEARSDSTEVLKEAEPGSPFGDAIDYDKGVGRGVTTVVYSKKTDRGLEKSALRSSGSLRTSPVPKNIVVTTETTVVADAAGKS
jgi:hypothetical protein